MTSEDSTKEKDVAFYSAAVGAWFTTNFEKDKHLLSLSSVGIGLLVTLMTTVGVSRPCIAIVYGLAVIAFLACILSVLIIFGRNAQYMEKVIKGEGHDEMALRWLDFSASTSFFLGVFFMLLIGVLSSIYGLQNKEKNMSDKTDKIAVQEKSLYGAHNLRPETPKPVPEKPSPTLPTENTSGSSSSSED